MNNLSLQIVQMSRSSLEKDPDWFLPMNQGPPGGSAANIRNGVKGEAFPVLGEPHEKLAGSFWKWNAH